MYIHDTCKSSCTATARTIVQQTLARPVIMYSRAWLSACKAQTYAIFSRTHQVLGEENTYFFLLLFQRTTAYTSPFKRRPCTPKRSKARFLYRKHNIITGYGPRPSIEFANNDIHRCVFVFRTRVKPCIRAIGASFHIPTLIYTIPAPS